MKGRCFGRNGAIGVILAFLLLGAACGVPGIAQEPEERPNLVIIMADDMGYSDLGAYGGEIQTPNLDRLADNGLRFTQFYNTGRCVPSRGSLLTGLYPHQAGVGMMVGQDDAPGYLGRLADRTVTIAEVLGAAGYQSFISGKWHVTHYDYRDPEPTLHRESWPLQRGFDRFYGHLSGAGSYFDMISLMKGNAFIPAQPRFEGRETFYYTDEVNDHAARFIREAREEEPLFLYIAHFAPHWPLHALPEDIEKYENTYDAGWDAIREQRYERMRQMGLLADEWVLTQRDSRVPAWDDAGNKDWEAHRMAVYAAMVDRMDQGIGRVIEALEETGRFDNTLILFLSDNGGSDEVIQGRETRHGYFPRGGTRPGILPGGPETYAAYGPEWANVSNTPFRLYKKWNHEGGVAAPFIAHWPEGITDRGGLRHEPGHVIDLMATAVDLAGAEYPDTFNGHDILPMEGVSLVPTFNNEPLERPEPIYFEHAGNRAVRDGRWKLVSEAGGDWELYDMRADRTETNDLSEEHPERVGELREKWQEWADRAFVNR